MKTPAYGKRAGRLNRRGFTIVELLIVMAITVFVLASTSKVLVTLMSGFKQQSKIAETGIESIVGIEMLRRDIQSAGHGIASFRMDKSADWSAMSAFGYVEAADLNQIKFNDAPSNPPRAIIGNQPDFTFNGSDYLTIKAVGVGNTAAAGKFHTLDKYGNINTWNPKLTDPNLDPNLQPTDYVVVVSPVYTDSIRIAEDSTTPGKFWTKFNLTGNFMPTDETEVRVIYGIVSGAGAPGRPRAPFNRVDYYINGNAADVPLRCSPKTGVLVRGVMSHMDGKFTNPMPLVDCVADMQLVFGIDSDVPTPDGDVDMRVNDLNGYSAEDILKRVKEVKVYILLHEGQIDPTQTFLPNPSNPASSIIRVGEPGFGRDFDLSSTGTQWKNYRWRVVSITEKPAVIK